MGVFDNIIGRLTGETAATPRVRTIGLEDTLRKNHAGEVMVEAIPRGVAIPRPPILPERALWAVGGLPRVGGSSEHHRDVLRSVELGTSHPVELVAGKDPGGNDAIVVMLYGDTAGQMWNDDMRTAIVAANRKRLRVFAPARLKRDGRRIVLMVYITRPSDIASAMAT